VIPSRFKIPGNVSYMPSSNSWKHKLVVLLKLELEVVKLGEDTVPGKGLEVPHIHFTGGDKSSNCL